MKFLSATLFSLMLISNAFAGHKEEELTQQYTRTIGLIQTNTANSQSVGTGVVKEYQAKGFDNKTGLDCNLKVTAMTGSKSGKIKYRLESDEDIASIDATFSSRHNFENGGQIRAETNKTSHKMTNDGNGIVITNQTKFTLYMDALLLALPISTSKTNFQISFERVGSQTHVQILLESNPIKTCTFEAK